MRIGFIGLGIMGRPMALNLRRVTTQSPSGLGAPNRASLCADRRCRRGRVSGGSRPSSELVISMVADAPGRGRGHARRSGRRPRRGPDWWRWI